MEKTLVILKPCTIQRGLIGEIISRFERKGLQLAGMKMIWLTDNILSEWAAGGYTGCAEDRRRLSGSDLAGTHERTRKHRPCFRFTRNSSHRVETFFQ